MLIEVQVHYLVYSLKESEEKPDQFDALYEAWISGDTEAVSDIVIGDYPETIPEVYVALVKGRNSHWAEIVDDLVQKQRSPIPDRRPQTLLCNYRDQQFETCVVPNRGTESLLSQ